MCKYRSRREAASTVSYTLGNNYLNLEVKPDQYNILQPTQQDVSTGQILKYYASEVGARKLAKHRLNCLERIHRKQQRQDEETQTDARAR